MRYDCSNIALLILMTALVRFPMIGKWGNSDEAWYAAIAAHNACYGRSPFDSPGTNASPTIAVYQFLTTSEGPYDKVPLDVLTLFVCAGVTVWIYWVVRNSSGRCPAFLAGIGFLIVQSLWEGLTSNREWYAVPFLAVAVHLLCRAVADDCRRSSKCIWYAFGAGAFVAFATGLKEQSLPFLAVGPGIFIVAAWMRAIPFQVAWILLWIYLIAFAIGIGIILLPHVWYGNVGVYLEDMRSRIAVEGAQNMTGSAPSNLHLLRVYGAGTVLNTEGRSVILAWALLSASYQIIQVIRSRQAAQTRFTACVFALAYITSVISVAGGGRFFDHYYLYLLPFGVPLIAMTASEILQNKSRAFAQMLPFMAVTLAQGLWGSIRGISADHYDGAIVLALAGCASAICYVTACCWPGIVDRLAIRSNCLSMGVAVAVMSLSAISLQRQIFRHPPTGDMAVQSHTVELVSVLEERKRAGDQIFVWGWQTRLYPASKMVPASQFVSVARVVHDFAKGQLLPDIVEPSPEMKHLILELERNRPRFIVDASRRSNTLSDIRIYQIGRHRDFSAFLDTHYDNSGSHGDYTLYTRRDAL